MQIRVMSSLSVPEMEQITKLARNKNVLECGAERGGSTLQLASVANSVVSIDWQGGDPCTGDHPDKRLEYTDVWLGNLFKTKLIDKIIPIVGRFEDILPKFRPGSFDMAFLDGNHQYEAVQRDIKLIYPLLRSGSIFAFHDYGREYGVFPDGMNGSIVFGVKQAVDEFIQPLDLELYFIESLAWVTLP